MLDPYQRLDAEGLDVVPRIQQQGKKKPQRSGFFEVQAKRKVEIEADSKESEKKIVNYLKSSKFVGLIYRVTCD